MRTTPQIARSPCTQLTSVPHNVKVIRSAVRTVTHPRQQGVHGPMPSGLCVPGAGQQLTHAPRRAANRRPTAPWHQRAPRRQGNAPPAATSYATLLWVHGQPPGQPPTRSRTWVAAAATPPFPTCTAMRPARPECTPPRSSLCSCRPNRPSERQRRAQECGFQSPRGGRHRA